MLVFVELDRGFRLPRMRSSERNGRSRQLVCRSRTSFGYQAPSHPQPRMEPLVDRPLDVAHPRDVADHLGLDARLAERIGE